MNKARKHTIRPGTLEAIVEAAIRLMNANPGVSMSEMAMRAGVGRATLHRHFRTRDDLLSTNGARCIHEMNEAVRAVDRKGRPAIERLRIMFEAVIPLGDRYNFLRFDTGKYEDSADAYMAQLEWVAALVNDLKAEGNIDPEVPARWVIAQIDQLVWGRLERGLRSASQRRRGIGTGHSDTDPRAEVKGTMSDSRRHEQLLPKDAYLDPGWLDRESRHLFSQSWHYACTEAMVPDPGSFHAFRFLDYGLFVVRDGEDELRAFHNLCRHRGAEVVEGAGNVGGRIRCPYHRWTYELDGRLRAVSNEKECFDTVCREDLGLLRASVGIYSGLVFVNPDPSPRDGFGAWIAGMEDHGWPHRFDDGSLEYAGETVYEMHCNWKVFYENAIDGYHLGYLHDKTLGPVYPSRNLWKLVGRNHVWYSTEREGPPQSSTVLVAETMKRFEIAGIPGHDEEGFYLGVVMLFPLTILSPNPYGFGVSLLEPKGPELTLFRYHSWVPRGATGRPVGAVLAERDPPTGPDGRPIRLADLKTHPLASGSFHFEDIWIVEKAQRNLHSPHFKVGPLARGAGAETPLVEFQEQVLEFVGLGGGDLESYLYQRLRQINGW